MTPRPQGMYRQLAGGRSGGSVPKSVGKNNIDAPSIAVVGGGYWGKNLVRNFHALGALHTVCDVDRSTLDSLTDKYPGIKISPEIGRVLSDPEIVAVAIATPAATHGVLVRQALEAGKDVYVEKPLCLSTAEGEQLSALADASHRVLMVGHLLWYHPVVMKLKEMVDAGELGRVRYIYSNRLNMGKLRREENVLWSFAPHDASVILGLVGEIPESVQAQGGSFLHEQVADTTVSMLNFSSGLRAHIFVSWLHPFKEQKLVVVGDKKMAVFNDTVAWDDKLHLYPHTVEWRGNAPIAHKGEPERIRVDQEEPLKAECQHFLDCVRQRSTPRTDGAEGLRVLRVLNACQEALENNRPVHLSKKETPATEFFAHDTAVIDADVIIGRNTKIWHFSHALPGTRIGEDCNIGQNVVMGPNVVIGNGCKIQNNVSVYEGVTLEDDVFCGPSMVFTNVINPRSDVARKDEYKPTHVGHGATIGANATIVCGNNLGDWSFVGAGAVVTDDVPAHALMVGNPARQIGWMCRCGKRLNDDLVCGCGNRRYRESDTGLVALDGPS